MKKYDVVFTGSRNVDGNRAELFQLGRMNNECENRGEAVAKAWNDLAADNATRGLSQDDIRTVIIDESGDVPGYVSPIVVLKRFFEAVENHGGNVDKVMNMLKIMSMPGVEKLAKALDPKQAESAIRSALERAFQ